MNPESSESNLKIPDLQKVNDTAVDVKKTISESVGNIGSRIMDVKGTISQTLDDFSSTSSVDAGKEFLEANTIVAKFSFIIIVLIGFLFLMRLGMIVISYIFSPTQSPYLVKGYRSGNSYKHIPQDPRANDPVIYLSENQRTGLEITYSVWLNLKTIETNKLNHIFNKGIYGSTTSADSNNIVSATGEIGADNALKGTYNAPGLYVYKNSEGGNNLRVYMDSYKKDSDLTNLTEQVKSVDITNVPLQKWFNVIIRVENRVLDVYVNGVLAKRMDLESIPRQNFGEVHISNDGGFPGKLSNLQYFNKSLNVFEINGIVGTGPDLKKQDDFVGPPASQNPYYLSSNWYSSNS